MPSPKSKNNAYLAVASTAVAIFTAASCLAADIRVFSGGAPREAVKILTPEFEKLTGHKVQITFLVESVIREKLAAGESPDMVIVPAPTLEALIMAGTLKPEFRPVLGTVGIAIGVRQGVVSPDISTPEKLKVVLLGARSVVHSNPKDTPSGAQMARVYDQLGIVEAMKAKTVHRNFLDGGAELIIKDDVDFGFYPHSAMLSVKGVAAAGTLPKELDRLTVYTAGIMSTNASPEPAQAYIKFLSDPANYKFWKQAGFEPSTR